MKTRLPPQPTPVTPQAPQEQPGAAPRDAVSPSTSGTSGTIPESRSARSLVTGHGRLDASDIGDRAAGGAMPAGAGAAASAAVPGPGRPRAAGGVPAAGVRLGVRTVRMLVTSPAGLTRFCSALEPLADAIATIRSSAREGSPAPPAPARVLAAVHEAVSYEAPE